MRRTAVANGNALLPPEGDPNGWWGRRYAEVLALRLDDMGGGELLSESQVSLAKRCTALEIELERREALLSTGADVDMAEFAAMTGTLARVAEKIGLRRVAREPMDLKSYVAAHARGEVE